MSATGTAWERTPWRGDAAGGVEGTGKPAMARSRPQKKLEKNVGADNHLCRVSRAFAVMIDARPH